MPESLQNAASVYAPRSAVDKIVWPALLEPGDARLLAILYQLEASQWWPAAHLARHQFRQLGTLLSFARQHVPLYRQRLAGLDPEHDLLAENAWQTLPILTREDIQNHYSELRSEKVPETHGPVTRVSTSGSTGKPITTDVAHIAVLMSSAFTLRGHRWFRRDVKGKLAMIHIDRSGSATAPDGLKQNSWGTPTSLVYQTGPSAVLSVDTPFDQQLTWLRRVQPDYLVTLPSVLKELLDLGQRKNLKVPTLQAVSTLGETVDNELRGACREFWGAEIHDIYSAKETGIVAMQCPDSDSYHVMAEGAYVEILDESGRPCAPGETGRLVVTRLHNFVMPLIRYDIGDYAEVGDPCPCGRGLPRLNRILGRARNMFRLPTGEKFWPSFGRRRAAEIAPIRQHQLVQTGPDVIEARLVVERPLTEAEETKLRDLFRSRLSYPFTIRFSYRDAIPRNGAGKYEYFICEWTPTPGPAYSP